MSAFKRQIIIFILLCFISIAYSQANESRIALVIGNSDYTRAPLKNPINDARDISAKLRDLGFDVVERNNIKIKQIGSTLSEFRGKLSPGSVALVFYAGHGIQIDGENYLPAVDADISAEEDVQNQSISVKQIMTVLDISKTRLNLVFLDACRNNPYSRGFRSAEGGLAKVTAPSGTLISYATRPGSVAADGDGRNGLYTSKLLKQLGSSQQIELSLKAVVSEVKAASKGKQEPWMEGSIEGEFCFAGCGLNSVPVREEAVSPALDPATIELSFWDSIKDSNNPKDFRAYLEQYPKGKFASIARNRLEPSAPAAVSPEHPVADTNPASIELSFWDSVKNSDNPEDFRAYLNKYPKGQFKAIAHNRLKQLAPVAVRPELTPTPAEQSVKIAPSAPSAPSVGSTGPGGSVVVFADSSGLHGLEAKAADEANKLDWSAAIAAVGAYGMGWRLPTMNELNLLYQQKTLVGGFTTDYYWSSQDDGNSVAWYVYFTNGEQNFNFKNIPFRVRAVRSF